MNKVKRDLQKIFNPEAQKSFCKISKLLRIQDLSVPQKLYKAIYCNDLSLGSLQIEALLRSFCVRFHTIILESNRTFSVIAKLRYRHRSRT